MLGKGSVNHNSRKFKAANVDAERSSQNITYCNRPIRDVYQELFDEALGVTIKNRNVQIEGLMITMKKYAQKQEKLFHEVILQIGNKENMAAVSENGKIAAKVLNEYMKGFTQRNPNLYVFSAHLHMDEATPHLHIDLCHLLQAVRGLDTRVSLKQALAAQGFYRWYSR